MRAQWNSLIVLALLLGLVVVSPKQSVSAADFVATFYFTSSLNPSKQYQAVTFTVSATGTDPDFPPFGYVTFYDDDKPILCTGETYSYYQTTINVNGDGNPASGIPAVCKTSGLTPGLHTITAEFSSWSSSYDSETLTLEDGQTVEIPELLTIGPETLPEGVFGGWYQQALTAVSDDGYSCGENCDWFVTGPFPAGMSYYSDDDEVLINGRPEQTGDFTFTMTARDATAGYEGSRTYTLTIDKATPVVAIFGTGSTPEEAMYLQASVRHPTNISEYPPGWVSFSVNGTPLEGCSGANARPVDEWGYATCITPIPSDLTPGSYPLRMDFTPTDAGYNSASAEETIILPARIEGLLFEDLNRDGVRDPETELPSPFPIQVSLDEDCDGTVDYSKYVDSNGQFAFNYLSLGRYCLIVPAGGNMRQTTPLGEITLTENQYFEIGLAYIQLEFSPPVLPNGRVGEPYSHSIGVTGGDSPYSVDLDEVDLPAGLTFDETTFTISGTPTAAGYGYLSLMFQDAGGAEGYYVSGFMIQTDGSFTLTSNVNPSELGQELTFTFTGAGDVVDPSLGGAVAPFGIVTFFDGENAIDGCVEVPLNYDLEQYELVDAPATCTTSALTDGLHKIKAVFTSWSPYSDVIRTLNQQIGPWSIFLPAVMRP